jgi:hypothetical protein
MTRTEFNKWTDEWFTAFPDSLAWLERLPNPEGTLETWFKCLSRCNYQDVADAMVKIVVGDLAPLEAYQREQTALHVRAYAGRIADERRNRAKNKATADKVAASRRTTHSGPGAASMFKAILEFREEAAAQGLEGHYVNEYASEKLGEWLEQQT